MARRKTVDAGATSLSELRQRIRRRSARVGIIGLGYVGLPLAVELAKEGFCVTGIDTDVRRITSINKGHSFIPDVQSQDIASLRRQGHLRAIGSYDVLKSQDVIVICVPTPLRKTREPDLSFILAATRRIASRVRRGQLIILESTTYPGTTDEVLLPMLEAGGLKAGRDFCLAFSPERIDPGNTLHTTRTIPKVIGGITRRCTRLAVEFYGAIMHRTVPVSSSKVAEMVKLLENTFRAVNVGLVNEVALVCNRLGIDVWEVIEAARTKPFGFMPFYPGPGLGGHCIPSDPMYLAWKVRLYGYEARFIELASQINSAMPAYVVERIGSILNARRLPFKGSRILLLGLAYKRDVGDTRDSPAFEVARLLIERGAVVSYHDPHVPTATLGGLRQRSIKLTASVVRRAACVVVLTNHAAVDYVMVARHANVILDTRNQYAVLAGMGGALKKIVKL